MRECAILSVSRELQGKRCRRFGKCEIASVHMWRELSKSEQGRAKILGSLLAVWGEDGAVP